MNDQLLAAGVRDLAAAIESHCRETQKLNASIRELMRLARPDDGGEWTYNGS